MWIAVVVGGGAVEAKIVGVAGEAYVVSLLLLVMVVLLLLLSVLLLFV